MATGARHSLHLVPESTYGTTPTTPGFLAVRHTSCSIGMSRDTLVSEELRSDRQISSLRLGQKKVGGSIVCEACNDPQLETLLEALLGGTWNTNVLKAGTIRRSFSMIRTFGDMTAGDKKYLLTDGVEIASAEIKVTSNAVATITFETVGQSQTYSLTAPASSTFGDPSTTAVMDGFSGAITEGGSPVGVVTEITLKIDNGIDPRYVIGSVETILPDQGKINITGSINVWFDSEDMLDKFIGETESSLSFTLTAGSDTLRISIPKLKYTGGQPDVSNDKSIILTMPFQAVYDSGSASNIVITRS